MFQFEIKKNWKTNNNESLNFFAIFILLFFIFFIIKIYDILIK